MPNNKQDGSKLPERRNIWEAVIGAKILSGHIQERRGVPLTEAEALRGI
jgi:hypothetical protein